MTHPFNPKIISQLKEGYSKQNLLSDITAGIVVGLVALPLAIAFAIGSGVKPEQGLYTAIIAGFFIALLGGSRVQVSGPTGAFIVVVYGIVQTHGYEGLALATLMAGMILVIMGISGLGSLLKFIPYPITVGFTSGIACIIFSSQVKDFFGLQMEAPPADFIAKWQAYFSNFNSFNITNVIIALASLAIIVLFPKITKRLPGSLLAIIIMTIIVSYFDLNVPTIQSTFGQIPNHLPNPSLPNITWEEITKLLGPAFTIALLGAIESLLSAVVADGMIGSRHRSNTELVAQGIGNIISPLFMGIPATGAIARTATNVKNGAKSPISAMVHSVVLLLIMLLLGHWASLIPMPTLSAVLVYVAYHMSEWRTFHAIIKKCPKNDILLLIVTFLLTVFVDLVLAIEVGVIIAALQFIKKMEKASSATIIDANSAYIDSLEEDPSHIVNIDQIPPGIKVFELYGPLFFAAIDRFKNALSRVEDNPKVFILRMNYVPTIDASGIFALEELINLITKQQAKLIIAGIRSEPLHTLKKAGLYEKVGESNFCESMHSAINKARDNLV